MDGFPQARQEKKIIIDELFANFDNKQYILDIYMRIKKIDNLKISEESKSLKKRKRSGRIIEYYFE